MDRFDGLTVDAITATVPTNSPTCTACPVSASPKQVYAPNTNEGLKVGLGVGIPLGLALLAALALLFRERRKSHRLLRDHAATSTPRAWAASSNEKPYDPHATQHSSEVYMAPSDTNGVHMAPNSWRETNELIGSTNVAEMDARRS